MEEVAYTRPKRWYIPPLRWGGARHGYHHFVCAGEVSASVSVSVSELVSVAVSVS